MKKKSNPVAELISNKVALSDHAQGELSEMMGFNTPNILSMLKSGKMKLAYNRVGAVSRALNIEESKLMRMTIQQNDPEFFNELDKLVTWKDSVNGNSVHGGKKK